MDIKQQIQQKAKEIKAKLIDIRHHIHSNPELSFQEFETQKFIENYLQNTLGLKTKRLAGTGVVALIEGKNPSKKVVGLRADMDALPILEANDGRTYRSTVDGVMHACGHDVHATCLLGAATILNQFKDEFEGTVKLIFQPGEEKLPGGASIMINEGVLNNPKVDFMIGQHVMPFVSVGNVGFRRGLYMASADEIFVTIKGKGGHGAMPHLGTDPVTITAQMIVALQQIVSRNANPIIPSVLTFGKMTANGSTNVIPNEVKLEGTFRTLDEKWRSEAHEKMIKAARGIVEGLGGTVEFEIRKGYPFLKNDEILTQKCESFATEYLGVSHVEALDIWMAAEDFSYFSQEVPSCFYRLGTRNEIKGTTFGVHHPNFDIDEDAIENGAGLMAYLAIENLNS
jgi:amidohydrolase